MKFVVNLIYFLLFVFCENACKSIATDQIQEELLSTNFTTFDPESQEDPEKIIGGTNAKLGEFPWRVIIISNNGNSQKGFLCGATILSSRWIVTAAHCLSDKKSSSWKHTVRAGSLNYMSGGQTTTFNRIIIHPGFNHKTMLNDIALGYLSNDLKLEGHVKAGCLPGKFKGSSLSGTVTASGWGRTQESGTFSQTLKKVNLGIITNAKCLEMMKKVGIKNPLEKTQLCTYTSGRDECLGDSGGSVDYKDSSGWYSVGIISYGWGCGKANPSIHTRLTEYIPWIESQTKVTNFCCT